MTLLDSGQAAKYLTVSKATFFRLLRKLPDFPRGVRVAGRARRWTVRELDDFLESRRIRKAG